MAATLVAGKLDEISLAIGELKSEQRGLRSSFDKHCDDDDRRHGENLTALHTLSDRLGKLTEVVAPLARAVEAMQPVVEQYKAARFKVIGAASIIMMLLGFIGWLIQTFIAGMINWLWKLVH